MIDLNLDCIFFLYFFGTMYCWYFQTCVIAFHEDNLLSIKAYRKQCKCFSFFFRFFTELEARHQNNIFIEDISDIVEKHTASTFDPYVKYCTNEVYQQRTLQKLL